MTLLLNEIHTIDNDLKKSFIIFAADRMISKDCKPTGNAKKIYEIKYLKAGVGFYGLAEFKKFEKKYSISNWLSNFINKNSHIKTMEDFARILASQLELFIPKKLRKEEISGFILAGFNKEGLPEHWFIRNSTNEKLQENYNVSEVFLNSKAREYGYDGKNSILSKPFLGVIYRHGQIYSHEIVEKRLNTIMEEFFRLPDFNRPTVSEYDKFVEFKIGVISHIFKKYSNCKVVGGHIDSFTLTP